MTAGLPVGLAASLRVRVNLILLLAFIGWAGDASAARTWSGGDGRRPSIVITLPTTSSTFATSAAQLTLTGKARDNVGVTRVTWRNDRGGSGTATGTTRWTIARIPLATGTNRIEVRAWDAAGNSRRAILSGFEP